jgi:hypothetical protein
MEGQLDENNRTADAAREAWRAEVRAGQDSTPKARKHHAHLREAEDVADELADMLHHLEAASVHLVAEVVEARQAYQGARARHLEEVRQDAQLQAYAQLRGSDLSRDYIRALAPALAEAEAAGWSSQTTSLGYMPAPPETMTAEDRRRSKDEARRRRIEILAAPLEELAKQMQAAGELAELEDPLRDLPYIAPMPGEPSPRDWTPAKRARMRQAG